MSRGGDKTVEVVDAPARWRPLAALGLAIVSWLPSARALLQGDLDVTVACVRFLVAVGVAWVGLGLVATVVRGYASAPAAGEPARPQRRRSDLDPAPDVPPIPDPEPGAETIAGIDAIDVNATETSA